ncbi:hypothetical protein SLEP1_g25464 [Rubroshorea leprosula]|uniref:Uncharacterized protein n=1 Tax=Rubroshorea leprosula TaxID=152421 RepID=A0AAV5JUM7_9ROSI|nr:hypothetical protein SLEP1_g25464 [Rubroshorea leprosula]
MNSCQHCLPPWRRERLYVLGGDHGVLEVKIEVNGAEVYAHLVVWVCEVYEEDEIGIQEVTHVQICCVQVDVGDVEPGAFWAEDEFGLLVDVGLLDYLAEELEAAPALRIGARVEE